MARRRLADTPAARALVGAAIERQRTAIREEIACLDRAIAACTWRDGEEDQAGKHLLALQARIAYLEEQLRCSI